jgi:hypothetical protein
MSTTTSLALAKLPERIQNGLYQYVRYGTVPGSFLRAVLENNLMETYHQADPESLLCLKDILHYVYWEIPGPCHGSPEIVKRWSEQGGTEGRSRRK